MNPCVRANTLLLIGDPHLTSRRPGRRMDEDIRKTLLGKLRESLSFARKYKAIPLCLGDLFDKEGENNLVLLGGLLSLLTEHEQLGGISLHSIVGNHDLKNTTLSDDTALQLMVYSGRVVLLPNAQAFEVCDLNGYPLIELRAYDSGKEGDMINDAKTWSPCHNGIKRMILTHANWAFSGDYPNALALESNINADWVINGHIHHPTHKVHIGKTIWFNPGNITRQTVDCQYIPSVYLWDTQTQDFISLELTHTSYAKTFDQTGRNIRATKFESLNEEASLGAFVQKIQEQARNTPATEDGSVLIEILESIYQEEQFPLDAQSMVKIMIESILSKK